MRGKQEGLSQRRCDAESRGWVDVTDGPEDGGRNPKPRNACGLELEKARKQILSWNLQKGAQSSPGNPISDF